MKRRFRRASTDTSCTRWSCHNGMAKHCANCVNPSCPLQHHPHNGNQNTDTIPLSPCSSRISTAQTQFSYPLTPNSYHLSRAQHIHMLHTPPTLLSTLISSTSPAIDKPPELRVPPIYASFLRRDNLPIVYVSALQVCGFHVWRLSKATPRYVAISICWSSV